MGESLIKNYTTALIRGFIEQANALKELKHKNLKGELRELVVSSILNSFLTSQFEVGSGTIINHRGHQSRQIDIIIYDNRVLPPFVKQQHLAVFPAECVVATMEVKSDLTKKSLLKAESDARDLMERIYNPDNFLYKYFKIPTLRPLCTVIGFYGTGSKELSDNEKGRNWLANNITHLISLCIANKYSWANMKDGWACKRYDAITNEETKRFFAILLDNMRTRAEERFKILTKDVHWDWMGIYIRDQYLVF